MILIETPLLDEIELSKWFHAKYSPAHMQEVNIILENHIWITARKIKIPVKEMSTRHIKNTIRCWNGLGKLKIPAGYLGGRDKWLKIFEQELLDRQ